MGELKEKLYDWAGKISSKEIKKSKFDMVFDIYRMIAQVKGKYLEGVKDE